MIPEMQPQVCEQKVVNIIEHMGIKQNQAELEF